MMGTLTEKPVPLRCSMYEWLALPHTITNFCIRINKKRRIRDKEATSRTVTEALGAPNPRRMARTDPCPNTQGGLRGHRSTLIKVRVESRALLAQDPTAYIDRKLDEFRQQFVGSNPGIT